MSVTSSLGSTGAFEVYNDGRLVSGRAAVASHVDKHVYERFIPSRLRSSSGTMVAGM